MVNIDGFVDALRFPGKVGGHTGLERGLDQRGNPRKSELARQEFSQSWAHATYFDAAASVTFPIFIAKSLEIRVAISGAMSDNIGERRYNKRLGALTTATRK